MWRFGSSELSRCYMCFKLPAEEVMLRYRRRLWELYVTMWVWALKLCGFGMSGWEVKVVFRTKRNQENFLGSISMKIKPKVRFRLLEQPSIDCVGGLYKGLLRLEFGVGVLGWNLNPEP